MYTTNSTIFFNYVAYFYTMHKSISNPRPLSTHDCVQFH